MNDTNLEVEKWKEERLKIVGASEISTVIKLECTDDELETAIGNSYEEFKQDKVFTTPFCLYNYKKKLAKQEPLSHVISEYGHELEKFAVYYVNKTFNFLKAKNMPQELIYNPRLSPLAAYTPDSLVKVREDAMLYGQKLFKKDGIVFEIKTNNLFNYISSNQGYEKDEVLFKYIIQNQYQLWIQNDLDKNYKWGMIACILPLGKEFDNDYYKGRAVELCQNLNEKNFKKLLEFLEIKIWIYPIFKSLHYLFEVALERWEKRLATNSEPKPSYISDKDTKIMKDRLYFYFDEFKVECQKKYGSENNGIVIFNNAMKSKYQNLYDKLSLDKQNREDKASAEKEVKAFEAEILEILFEEKILGFDLDDSKIYVRKWGKGLRLANDFKTSEERNKFKEIE